jgi:hypothetical protein
MRNAAKLALEHALSWWETVKTIVDISERRGITLFAGYEPSWIKEARAAVEYVCSKTEEAPIMGYMRHHAIAVTSFDEETISKIYSKAEELFPVISPIMNSSINGYKTFFVPPDGSKEGWKESAFGDKAREAFITLLRAEIYEDGSPCLDWFEAQYGDEDDDNRFLSSSRKLM